MNLKKYKQAQAFLESLPSIQGYMTKRRHPSFYLERMRTLLALLHNPEKKFSYIHITGTSGKGSVTTLLHTMLKESGKRVGAYLSPHTSTVVERLLINGKTISAADFVWGVNAIKPAIRNMLQQGKEYAPSYFEALFAVALLLFQKYRIQWVVLEVGCGGQFDATNTIPSPKVTIITNIHLDHRHLLGKTRKQIADTKSGIIKPGTFVITGEQDPEVRKRILAKARSCKTKVDVITQPHNSISLEKGKMQTMVNGFGKFSSPLLGAHQLHNIAIAIRAAQRVGLSKKSILRGIQNTKIPCRSEFIQRNPDVMLDGAHNPAKIRALVSLLKHFNYKRIHVIMGIGHNKSHLQMFKNLLPTISSITFTSSSVDVPKPESPKVLLKKFKTVSKKPSHITVNPFDALRTTIKNTQKNELALVTGSLYLAGELRTEWISEQYILQHHSSFLV
jgi:dihydrofolate synthase/folylpolyglutamate synthase